jgi:hypothetical protein
MGGGGGKLGSTLGVVYVGETSQICGGVIQNTDQRLFCCKTAGACSTKGHKTKVSLSTKTIYVRHTGNGHAQLEPSLGASLLPDDVTIGDLLEQENLLEGWVAYFESLQAKRVGATAPSTSLSNTALSPWEEVKLPTLVGLQKARDSFKTPKKLRLGSVLVPETISVANCSHGTSLTTMVDQDINDKEDAKTIKIERALQIIMADWNKLEVNFQLIHTEFDTPGRSESKYRNLVSIL